MKVVCISGGSYKAFYLNYFIKIKSCDLLVFNFGILYEYDVKEELLGSSIVTKELIHLYNHLHCPIVAGILVRYGDKVRRSFIVCDEEKVYLAPIRSGVKITINNKTFVIGTPDTEYSRHHKIILSNRRIYPNVDNCSSKKIYIFCDKFGLNYIYEKKLIRKFHKYSKIILK